MLKWNSVGLALLAAAAAAYASPASATCPVPHQLTNGQIADATTVMGNFNALANCAGVDQTAWTTYTPSVTAGAGTFGSVSATGRYKQIGKTVFVSIDVTITTNGTANNYFIVTAPTASANIGANHFHSLSCIATTGGRRSGTGGAAEQQHHHIRAEI